jgi:hypothetical protein
MCDVTAGSGHARTTPRPRWGLLFGLATLMLAALAAVEFVVSAGPTQTVLRCGLALGGFAAMALWARRNRVAIDAQGWCDCAGATVSVRVIPSRRREQERIEEEERGLEERVVQGERERVLSV